MSHPESGCGQESGREWEKLAEAEKQAWTEFVEAERVEEALMYDLHELVQKALTAEEQKNTVASFAERLAEARATTALARARAEEALRRLISKT